MIDVSTKQARARFYGSTEWRKLRSQCLERDHYECQWCKAEGRLTTQHDSILEVDHIKELEYHPNLALDINNLRTLCKDCHNKRHNRMKYRGQQKKRKWDDEWW
ncbi:HNH endonuclease [Enterococcus hirae]|uniref:HNH endonuclease n=1 Tax=Enterococcus TaxID=1350 RepID=UPI0008DCE0BB|nr:MULTISPECIES: HNH endonuclease [Enterococcus]KAB5915691.1 HNH endonuclease [Bifidobacterium adolescentis]CAJ1858470.1 HNH endonuclease [uncultured phage]EMF0043924.1 HNH endonuclease [Enterococcus hirae]EMF0120876.1 HNH endonuclease [Enterococcus hirae]NAA11461.1 HNH endonuclease [Enterococcus hirae]